MAHDVDDVVEPRAINHEVNSATEAFGRDKDETVTISQDCVRIQMRVV